MSSPDFNIWGVLAPDTYDALVGSHWKTAAIFPATRSVAILGTGGSAFVRRFLQDPPAVDNPLDSYAVDRVEEIREELRGEGFGSFAAYYWEQRQGTYADFVAIGRAAGLGTPSKLALLLHPEFGTWFGIRALVFTDKPMTATGGAEFDPCAPCPAPCESACHGAAAGFPFDVAACLRQRLGGQTCRSKCDARRACPIGQKHTYDPDIEEFHARASLSMPG